MNISELKDLQNKVIEKSKKISYIYWLIEGTILELITIVLLILIIKFKSVLIFNFFMTILFEFIFSYIIYIIVKHSILGDDINTFNKNYKSIFVQSSLNEVFDDLKYTPEKGVSEEDMEKVGLIRLEDRFSSNDYISGTYKKIDFEQSDVEIQRKEVEKDKDGNEEVHWVTTFEGRWMNFDFNKKFKTNVLIYDHYDMEGAFSYKHVSMEDTEFNKMFSVYAENEHEAFYILTPHFMEKIKNIRKIVGNSISFGFINSRLYIAINNYTDSFEYNIYKPINEKDIRDNIMKDIKVITDFVDELDLDNDLFKEV